MNFKDDFSILNTGLVYLDNGATTLTPKCVLDKMNDYYNNYNSNIHRGDYKISLKTSNEYEEVRSDKMGNAYVNPRYFYNDDGSIAGSAIEESYFGKLALTNSVAAQGSTRVIARASNINGKDVNSTMLSNIASVTKQEMLALIEAQNERKLRENPNASMKN